MSLLTAIQELFGGRAKAAGESNRNKTMSKTAESYKNNWVGPIIRASDVAQAAIEAVEIDNPGQAINVDDHKAYIRIQVDDECVLTRDTMANVLGRPFEMRELELNLSSFAGQIETSTDRVRFYFEKRL